MYDDNPTPAETALLALIAHRESGDNANAHNPISTAEGLYQFIIGTWQWICGLADISLQQYPTAASAPRNVQTTAALLLLRLYGPNSTKSWKASGPYPAYAEVQLMLKAVGVST